MVGGDGHYNPRGRSSEAGETPPRRVRAGTRFSTPLVRRDTVDRYGNPRKAGCAVSEKAERTTAQAGPPSPPIAVGLPKDSPAQRADRQRRPTGAPPPLPHPIAVSTTAWLILAVVGVATAFLISEQPSWLRPGDRANTWFLRCWRTCGRPG